MGTAATAVGLFFLVAGAVGFLGGLGAVGLAWMDEDGNQERRFPDPGRSGRNEDTTVIGAVVAGASLLLMVLATPLLVDGRRRGGVVRLPPAGLASDAAALGVAAPGPASRSTATTARRLRGRAAAEGGRPAGLAAALALASLALFATALLLAEGEGPAALLYGDASRPVMLGEDRFDGSLERSVSGPFLGSVADGQNGHDVRAPAGAHRLEAVVEWSPEDTGAQRLRLVVTSAGQEVARMEGGPDFVLTVLEDLGGAELHYQVVPADDVGAVAGQSFTVWTTFWSA